MKRHRLTGKAGKLRVFSSQFDEDELPVKDLFRTLEQMPLLEQKALRLAHGRILDVGAGSGCHSLALQNMGKESLAIDISPLSVEVMKRRGLDARLTNVFDMGFTGQFDTILMLMNGSGIIGKLKNMHAFLMRVKQLLAPGGCVLMDSSDLRYLYEDEDGSYLVDLAADYYGEVDFQMQASTMITLPACPCANARGGYYSTPKCFNAFRMPFSSTDVVT